MKLRSICAVTTLVLTVLFGATPATAQSTAEPTGCTYWFPGGSWGDSCFSPNGDVTWVDDLDENGWSPVVLVEASYKENPGDEGFKTRYCEHDPGAWSELVLWTSCNFDHRETHCVRWWLYEKKIGTGLTRNYRGPTSWIGADDGKPGNCIIE